MWRASSSLALTSPARQILNPATAFDEKLFRGEADGDKREGGGRKTQARRGREARAQSDGRAGAQRDGGARRGGGKAAAASGEAPQALGRHVPPSTRRARRSVLRVASELLRQAVAI